MRRSKDGEIGTNPDPGHRPWPFFIMGEEIVWFAMRRQKGVIALQVDTNDDAADGTRS